MVIVWSDSVDDSVQFNYESFAGLYRDLRSKRRHLKKLVCFCMESFLVGNGELAEVREMILLLIPQIPKVL